MTDILFKMKTVFQSLICICLVTILYSCGQKSTAENVREKEESVASKINGLSFVASGEELRQEHIHPVIKVNANAAAIMPFGFIKNLGHPEIIFNSERQWFGETKEGVTQYVALLHKNGIRVMLKPQIWIWHGEFTGKLKMNKEEDWDLLEDSYREFILDFAQLAEEIDVEIFCIGTELEKFIEHRPEFWHQLVTEIKTVYNGKLTYAANWDEYKRVPFWKGLDYIGVDAYFPISESKTPTSEETRKAWQTWKTELKALSERENKPILFTEYGYRSVDFSGKEPWKSDRDMMEINMEAQVNSLQALYQEVWKEEWFAGGFLWKWFTAHSDVGGDENSQFTPQNKPAEEIVSENYKLSL